MGSSSIFHILEDQFTYLFMGRMRHFLAILSLTMLATCSAFHVEIEGSSTMDRTLCNIQTQNACAQSCQNTLCTETCSSTCGFLFRQTYTYLCSAVAASTCTVASPSTVPSPPGISLG